MRAIAEIEEDSASGHPMDRLVCGDVGFGKTEVAMRAAANVVFRNRQCKTASCNYCSNHIISASTLQNFNERFAQTEIKITQLSRLITQTKAKEVRAQIENGDVQIIVGTHALFAKITKFKNLAFSSY